MDKPTITLEGQAYKLPEKITMSLYRQITNNNAVLNEIISGNSNADMVEICADDLAVAFGVDKELLAKELDIADILPTRRDVAEIVLGKVTSKFQQIPNGEAAKE